MLMMRNNKLINTIAHALKINFFLSGSLKKYIQQNI